MTNGKRIKIEDVSDYLLHLKHEESVKPTFRYDQVPDILEKHWINEIKVARQKTKDKDS